ncbi:MAG: permease [Bacteriovoracaceae bacterium]
MADCCPSKIQNENENHCSPKNKTDWFFYLGIFLSLSFCLFYFLPHSYELGPLRLHEMGHVATSTLSKMWWGVLVGIFFVGLLDQIPTENIQKTLGSKKGVLGIFKATLAGILFDLCNHGILMVGMKLYDKGATLGQTMAFLIASPWNSFSLTFVLVGLVGLPLTILFVVFSALVAIITGIIFDKLVFKGTLPQKEEVLIEENSEQESLLTVLKNILFVKRPYKEMIISGVLGSKIIVKWLLWGVVIASLLSGFLDEESFKQYFGTSLVGMGLTILFATVVEVCSEGAAPIAAQIVNKAGAPGNGFTFLMAGVSTDYTEIMMIREKMNSWKIALFLPLITLPQIIVLGIFINKMF